MLEHLNRSEFLAWRKVHPAAFVVGIDQRHGRATLHRASCHIVWPDRYTIDAPILRSRVFSSDDADQLIAAAILVKPRPRTMRACARCCSDIGNRRFETTL